jgi:hypothetical protein
MNICRLNQSTKVCLEKGPARHTRTPLSSFPVPNTFPTYNVPPRLESCTHPQLKKRTRELDESERADKEK